MKKGIFKMEERSLKVLENNTTFFNKLSTKLTKLLIPTRLSLNGMMITMKRNAVLKAYENTKDIDTNDKSKEENLRNRYEESYTLYLESIDKYIMDSVYKKVKNGSASSFEKNALSNYYNVVHLKDSNYSEYKARKQKFLLDLDYESIISGGKEKIIKRYKKMYIEKCDELYKSILKNYCVGLADGVRAKNLNQIELYKNIFQTLEEYAKTILPLKIENGFDDFDKIKYDYNELDKYDIGRLEEKDFLEKNMILLGMSRILFTHSLPLVAAEQCYKKLVKDARNLIVTKEGKEKKEECYETLIKISENYNEKLLSTKVYWENPNERERFKNFWKEYQMATTDEKKEIAMLKNQLQDVTEDGPKAKQIRQFFKEKLVEYGVMRQLKNSCKTIETEKLIKKKVEEK